MLYDATHSELRGFVVNDQTYYVGHSLPVEQMKEAHRDMAEKAAVAMYGRHPHGLDEEGEISRCFNTPCQQLILTGVQESAQIFASENMSQKFQSDRPIIETESGPDAWTMLVEGDVVQVRVEHGTAIPNSVPMRLIFRLERNARWGVDGKYPLVITRFTATTITPNPDKIATK